MPGQTQENTFQGNSGLRRPAQALKVKWMSFGESLIGKYHIGRAHQQGIAQQSAYRAHAIGRRVIPQQRGRDARLASGHSSICHPRSGDDAATQTVCQRQ